MYLHLTKAGKGYAEIKSGQVITKMNLMGIQISMMVVYKQRQREFFIVAKNQV